MKTKILMLLFLLFSTYTYAMKVDGTVLDENNLAIIGATIQIKGQEGVGTVTDFDGKFVLDVPNVKKATLIVSYIGYKTKHVPLNGRTIITVQLEPDVTELDEVVVVGYGAMRKSDLTGSVSSVKTNEMEAARTSTFDQILRGKAAGVTVTTGNSAPGGAVSVQIRGVSSLRGDSSPLYVVDGVILDTDETGDPMSGGTGGGNSRLTQQNPLSVISPQDIASIEILKDASATAIYGSKGANGVVLITTKRGDSSKPTVTFSMNTTVSSMAKKIDVLGFNDYLDFVSIMVPDKEIDMNNVTPVNWQDESTRVAVSQNYRATLSGKSNKTKYYLALGYMDNKGIIENTGVSKYDMRLNLDQEINKYFNLGVNTLFANTATSMTTGTDKLASNQTSLIRHMLAFKPYRTLDASETIDFDENLTTPDAWFTGYDDDSKESAFMGNVNLDIKPFKWFTIRLKGGVNYKNKDRSMWFGTELAKGKKVNGAAGQASMTSRSYNGEAMLMFNHTFNKVHSLSATAGVDYNKKSVEQRSVTGEGFANQSLRADGISQAQTLYPFKYNYVGEQFFSALTRVLYSYNNRYSVTATFRADGSSKFSKSNRFSYFPSFAAAWRVKEESFMKDVDWISNFKFRAGWGQVGNQAVSPYQILNSYNPVYYAKPDGSQDVGYSSNRISNPDLKWEMSDQYNIGVDLGFLDQRLNVSIDAYIKNTKDLLQEIAIGTHTGYSSMWVNNGEIQNRGLEISVDATPIMKKNWKWSIGGNISFNRNEIKYLGMEPSDFGVLKNQSGYYGSNLGNNNYIKFPANVFLVGHSVGLFLGYETNGIMQEDYFYSLENQKNPLKINNELIEPGDIFVVDKNGDRVIDASDKTIIGNPNPDFVYALNTSLSYKKWTLDLAFDGVYGNEIINANLIDLTDVKNSNKNILSDAYFQAWTPENRSNSYPKLGWEPTYGLMDRYIEDGSYFRLSNITLSYLFSFKKTKAVKSLSLSFNASNVFTISSYSGFNPDVNTFSNEIDRIGVDQASYPLARHYSLGAVLTF